MADEKASSKGTSLLARHAEKIGLGVAGAALIAYLVVGVLMAGPDDTVRKLTRNAAALTLAKAGPEQDDLGPGKREPTGTRALDPYTRVEPAKKTDSEWAVSYRTEWDIKLDEVKDNTPPPKPSAMPPLTLAVAKVEHEGITLSIQVGEAPKDAVRVEPNSFSIERKTGTEDWKPCAKLTGEPAKVAGDAPKPPPTTYQDKQIVPKTVYKYRVRAASSDEKWVKENKGAEEARDPSNEVEAKALGVFKFEILNPIAGSVDEDGKRIPGKIYAIITKYDARLDPRDNPVTVRRTHSEGDRIGWWPEAPGESETSVHRVSLRGGRVDEIDMNTGFVLKSVDDVVLELERLRCVLERDEMGGGIRGCNQVKEKVKQSNTVVVYTDDEGKEQKWYVKEPKVADVILCEKHGAGRPGEGAAKPEALLEEARSLWKEEKLVEAVAKYQDLKKNHAESKVYADNKQEIDENIVKGRDTLAKRILDEANKAWDDERKSDARRLYRDLLRDYPDTATYKSGRSTLDKRIPEDVARALLKEADALWKAKKWKDAVAKYREIKSRFAKTEFYNEKKEDIEQRIKEGTEKLRE